MFFHSKISFTESIDRKQERGTQNGLFLFSSSRPSPEGEGRDEEIYGNADQQAGEIFFRASNKPGNPAPISQIMPGVGTN
jgi:hypothetical protein